jgi:hypothetical protein
MNYARIYDEFIADRRASPAPSNYSELHHVVPRSLGGSNDKENLIRLTPEDHYFAHLLLAKWHGGNQWFAVVRMGSSRADGIRSLVRARLMYGAARRHSASVLSIAFSGQPGMRGEANGMYDDTLHNWTNLDTLESAVATKSEMWILVGGCRGHWTSVVSGARKSMMGWTTKPENIRVRSSKGKVFHFANDNGEIFAGTQSEFATRCGLSGASASRIARGLTTSPTGWRVEVKDAAA